MKVSELIAQLKDADPEAIVVVSCLVNRNVMGQRCEVLVKVNSVEHGSGKPKLHFDRGREPDEGEDKLTCLVCEGS